MKGEFFLFAALAANVCAHGNGVEGLPQLMGARKFLSAVKSRSLQLSVDNFIHKRDHVEEKRATSDGRCGPGIGSCTNCCSANG
ncbi:putative glycoside hydrolase deacetylase [Golovinomyces cichoracearum]|uniref:Putative glycoside hydrolase deacetylase n=1 Tax=Golovinomyces cichoracearum TaxID=62708 RepID=A0A420GQT8_9PEZI|nr:putative glycoside hydrolase deacetylase [Golovinomyces cichoracearum]